MFTTIVSIFINCFMTGIIQKRDKRNYKYVMVLMVLGFSATCRQFIVEE